MVRPMPLDVPLDGFVAPGFEPVRAAFAQHLERGEESGAAVAVFRAGEPVVDLWGGWSDRGGRGRPRVPWDRDTLIVIFSATKGLAALVLLKLAESGAFDYEDRVADHWPGFAKNGKGDITIRQLLNHRAGLAGLDHPLTLEQVTRADAWPDIVAALEAQAPAWAPGTDQAYHATTYGLYVAELIRRVAPGIDVSTYFRDTIAAPLGADTWLGAPAEVDARVAQLYPPSILTRVRGMAPSLISGEGPDGQVSRAFLTPRSLTRRAFLNPHVPSADLRLFNALAARRTPLLWASGVSSARGLARIYAPLADGGEAFGHRLVRAEALPPLHARQGWSERDPVLGKPLGWSQGFLKEETTLFSPHPESFGHAGLGGSLGWADPITRTSFAYVTNSLDWRVRSKRCIELCHALHASPALRA